jgi:D-alanine-D-alanine ligase
MIVGSYKNPDKCIVYKPVERIFHESLSEEERFLSFDRLWEIYEDETPMPNGGSFYHYTPCDARLSRAICKLSLEAYCAVKGQGYTRIDIRMDATTKKLYVLEVNAQCGLSEDEDYTSIGAILRFAGKSFTQLVQEIINDTFANRGITR